MAIILYFGITVAISRNVFTFFSNRYGWKNKLWNNLFPKASDAKTRMMIWFAATLVIQLLIPLIFQQLGLVEPYLRIPSGILFGVWLSLIPLRLVN